MSLGYNVYQQALSSTLDETSFEGLGELQRGKVRDSYVLDGKRAIVVSDRLSAFDRVITTIPFKGQILNQLAAFWLEQTRGICPNHLQSTPDPSVSLVENCTPLPVEMIVRGYLTGSSPTSIWTHYARGAAGGVAKGTREYCGLTLPDGLHKHQAFETPLLTPTTKGEAGAHDELISAEDVVAHGLVSAEDFAQLTELSLALFSFGQTRAAERGLILVDTKYEFGKNKAGEIRLIDEVHTPDSSRYWYQASYEKLLESFTGILDGTQACEDPKALDKEYVRRHLGGLGFSGEGEIPVLADEVRIEAAKRYVEIYEVMTGKNFVPNTEAPAARIEAALTQAFAK